MTRTGRFAALILTVIMMLSIIPASVFAAVKNGWHSDGEGRWFYYEDSQMVKSRWMKIGGKWYYFHYNGEMAHNGLVSYDDKMYMMDADGALVTKAGWYKLTTTVGSEIKSFWFYLKADGTVTIGWKQIGKKWYYFDSWGIGIMSDSSMYPNGMKQNGKLYFFNKDGSMKTNSWAQDSDGAWYYVDKSGAAVTGWKQIDKKWYYFGKDGIMFADRWLLYPDYSSDYYHFGKSGAMDVNQWVCVVEDWYYQGKDGKSVTGWKKIGSKWYFFNPANFGICVTNTTRFIDGKWYTFDKNGVCVNPKGSDTAGKVA